METTLSSLTFSANNIFIDDYKEFIQTEKYKDRLKIKSGTQFG